MRTTPIRSIGHHSLSWVIGADMTGIRLHIVLFIFLFSGALSSESAAQTKRAVVVGINTYAPTETGTGFTLRKWKDLDGAVNDAQAMEALLLGRFEFDEVTLLLEEDATRDAIFSALQAMQQASSAGDVALFYYAGHGSQVKNLASTEADGLDETIVPSDVPDGSADIRDKELRGVFNGILDRGSYLTLIFDSCHSGSITRGLPGTATRFLERAPGEINDPTELPRPVDRGALILSSAQDNQLASEMLDDGGNARGAFSWALNRALSEMDVDAPASDVFLKARALMKGRGLTQNPVIGGLADRRDSPLFGGVSTQSSEQSVLVLGSEDSLVSVQGGLATGLRPGSELRDIAGRRFEVSRAAGPASSLVRPLEHDIFPEAGDELTVTKWVAAEQVPVRFYIPRSASSFEDVLALGQQFGAIDPVADPTSQPAGSSVLLAEDWSFVLPDGTSASLSSDLVDDVRSRLSASDTSVHVELPAFQALAEFLEADLLTMGLSGLMTDDRASADYILTGRFNDGTLQYAWVRASATRGDSNSPAPPRSDYLTVPVDPATASTVLARDVKRLNVIYGWLGLSSPPDEGAFPYAITGFEDVDSGSLTTPGDTLSIGNRYRIILEASQDAIFQAQMQASISNSMMVSFRAK